MQARTTNGQTPAEGFRSSLRDTRARQNLAKGQQLLRLKRLRWSLISHVVEIKNLATVPCAYLYIRWPKGLTAHTTIHPLFLFTCLCSPILKTSWVASQNIRMKSRCIFPLGGKPINENILEEPRPLSGITHLGIEAIDNYPNGWWCIESQVCFDQCCLRGHGNIILILIAQTRQFLA